MTDATVTLVTRVIGRQSFGVPQLAGGSIDILIAAPIAAQAYMQHPCGEGDITWQGAEFGMSAPSGSNVTRVSVTFIHRVSDPAAFSSVAAQLYANGSPIGSPLVYTPEATTNVTQTLSYYGGMTPAHLATLAVQVNFHQVSVGLGYVLQAYAEADYSFADSVGIITVAGETSVPALTPSVALPAVAKLVSQGAVGNYSPSFGQPTTAGNLLIAWTLDNADSGMFSTTCNNPNWELIGYAGAAFNWRALWYRTNCRAGEIAPVFSSGGSLEEAQLLEFSGVLVLDQSGTWFNASTGNFTVTASTQDTRSGDFVAAIMIWVGGGATTPVTSTVSGEDSSGTPLTLTTYTNDLTSGQIPYAFSWAQAGTGVGPDITQMTATLSSFGESGAILATFYTGVLSSFPQMTFAPVRNPVNRVATIPVRAGRR